ncbi:MAG: hypothetical protein J6D54_08160 [Olsenella sp.]|nr:hypothetical protein [Olsenella sp.]
MKFTRYIATHHAFTTSDLMAAMDSPASAEEQLRLAVRSGAVERVRRGLLVSNYGRYEDAPIDPAAVVMAADPEAVLSYHSALEAHGVAHNVGFVCLFRSDVVRSPFSFRGVGYEPCGSVADARSRMLRTDSSHRRVTTKEQTLVDCLDRPSLAGGAEEAVRGVTAFAYLDIDELLGSLNRSSASTVSRVGWLLEEKAEDWHVGEELLSRLESRLGKGPYRLGRPHTDRCGWSSRWRLLLPEGNEEVETWITRS